MTISRDDWDELGFDTLAVRAGQVRTGEGEQSEPIFSTSSSLSASSIAPLSKSIGIREQALQ